MNAAFKQKYDEMMAKYHQNIAGISRANNVDMGVAFDMLVCNAKSLKSGDLAEIKPGGGKLDYYELMNDVVELDNRRRV